MLIHYIVRSKFIMNTYDEVHVYLKRGLHLCYTFVEMKSDYPTTD